MIRDRQMANRILALEEGETTRICECWCGKVVRVDEGVAYDFAPTFEAFCSPTVHECAPLTVPPSLTVPGQPPVRRHPEAPRVAPQLASRERESVTGSVTPSAAVTVSAPTGQALSSKPVSVVPIVRHRPGFAD